MQMLVFITKQTECINPILADLLNRNISGATVIDCEGMLKAINESSIDPPPVFGSIRHFINPGQETVKMLMIIPRDDERLALVKQIIHEHAGRLDRPNTGIMFEIPVMNVEGVSKKS